MILKENIMNSIRESSHKQKFDQFMKVMNPSEKDKILDVGISDYTIAKLENYFEDYYPFQDNLTGLGLGDLSNFKKKYLQVNAISYEWTSEKRFPFKDNVFDISVSNAVLEHVGKYKEDQIIFLEELVRVSKKGLFTTPNKFFPVETHYGVPFLHWMNNYNFLKLMNYFCEKREILSLLGKKDLISLCEESKIPNYKIIPNKFMGLNMTFSVVWDKNNSE